jgi:hypothetical protein
MSQLSRKISDENTGEHNIKSQKNSRTGSMAGPKGKVEQERMQVCLNEYLCRCLQIWQVQ